MLRKLHYPVAALCAVIMYGCSEARPETTAVTSVDSPPIVTAAPLPSASTPNTVPSADPAMRLVEQAFARHLSNSALEATVAAARAREQQATVWANPTFAVQAGRARLIDSAHESDTPFGISISQRFEWQDRRNSRCAVARAEAQQAETSGIVLRINLEAEVRLALIAWAVSQTAVLQAEDFYHVSTDFLRTITAAHDAGDVDDATWLQARREAATAHATFMARQQEAITTRDILILWCGDVDLTEKDLAGLLPAQLPELDIQDLQQRSEQHPANAALEADKKAAQSRCTAARFERAPDITVGVFAEREIDKSTVGLSLAMDLPLWNRTSAGIAAAEADYQRLAADQQAQRLERQRRLAAASGEYAAARAEVMVLEQDAAPAARDFVGAQKAGLHAHEVHAREVMNAQREMIAIDTALLSVRRRAAEALVHIGQSVGRFQILPNSYVNPIAYPTASGETLP